LTGSGFVTLYKWMRQGRKPEDLGVEGGFLIDSAWFRPLPLSIRLLFAFR